MNGDTSYKDHERYHGAHESNPRQVVGKDTTMEERFDEEFGTGIDFEGYIIGGANHSSVFDYDKLKAFIASEKQRSRREERGKIHNELVAIWNLEQKGRGKIDLEKYIKRLEALTHTQHRGSMKVECTIEKFEEYLKLIGWSFSGRLPNRYIANHKGERTLWRVLNDRIELDRSGFDTPIVCFYYTSCDVEVLENQTVCLSAKGTDSVFVLFPNYDLKGQGLAPLSTTEEERSV